MSRFRFSLRFFFMIFTIIVLLTGLLGVRLERARQQCLAVKALEDDGAVVSYEAKYERDTWCILCAASRSPPTFTERLEDRFAKWFGPDFVYRVGGVYGTTPATADFLRQVHNMPGLEDLSIYVGEDFGGDAWKALLECRQIQYLVLRRDQSVETVRLTGLSRLTQLRELTIDVGELTLEDAHEIVRLPNLKDFDLIGTGLDAVVVARLQKALPNCNIKVR